MLALCLVNPVTTFAADPAALEKLKSDSDRGDPAALFALGKAYATGDGVAHDDAKAFECYRKSAELGNAKAQHNLGGMYLNGLAVKKDEQEALNVLNSFGDAAGFVLSVDDFATLSDASFGAESALSPKPMPPLLMLPW